MDDDDGQPVALIPFSWALLGMVLLTCMVTILSEWLVGSIDGFCVQFGLSHAFVGVIVLLGGECSRTYIGRDRCHEE